jgi:hypothetical protein
MDTTQTTRFPAAEKFARNLRLPMAIDPVARELYGVADIVLDERAARAALLADGHCGPAMEAGVEILRERAARAVAL